jgi:aminocarboxymuconate-semialdehyde decarboxylase
MARKAAPRKAAKKPAARKSAAKKTVAKKAAPRRAPAAVKPRRRFAIDWHTHIFVPEVVAFNADHMVVNGFRPAPENANRRGGERGGMTWQMDTDGRLAKMDEMRVDVQVISASLVHQCTYWAEPQDALRYDRLSNDRIAEFCATRPDRFAGIATVPLQSPALAASELERAVGLGLKGANISSNVNGVELGLAGLDAFWAKAQELDVPVYIHPHGTTGDRFQRYLLWNSIGQSFEETMAMFSLIHDGVMDAYPKLKIVFAHGGGFLPFAPGRVDRNTSGERLARLGSKAIDMASTYLDRFWYDTCLYDAMMLDALADRVGPERLVMGSDYPVGELDPVGFIQQDRELSTRDKAGVLGETAAKLLKL